MKFATIVYTMMCHLSLMAIMASRPSRFIIRSGYVLTHESGIELMVDSVMTCCSLCRISGCTAVSWHGDSTRCLYANIPGIPIADVWFDREDGWTSYDLLPAVVKMRLIPLLDSFQNAVQECEDHGLTIASEDDVRNDWKRELHDCACGYIETGVLLMATQHVDVKCFPMLMSGINECSSFVRGNAKLFVWCKGV